MKEQVQRSLTKFRIPAKGSFSAHFRFGKELSVFEGHFPGFPIVPGVFLIEGVRLGLERALSEPLRLSHVADAKFLAPVSPDDAIEINASFTVDDDRVQCEAEVMGGDVVVAKLKLKLTLNRSTQANA